MTDNNTIKFTVPHDDSAKMRRILRTVFDALDEKGYNPINQIVGYLLSEDPTYITNYNNARTLTDADSEAVMSKVLSALEAQCGATLR